MQRLYRIPLLLLLILISTVALVESLGESLCFLCPSSAHLYLRRLRGDALSVAARRHRPSTQLMSSRIVKVSINGDTYDVTVNPGDSILEAAEEAGLELPHDCRLGTCLQCTAKVVSGSVDHGMGTLDDEVTEAGYTLACQATPLSDDVHIEIVEEDEVIDKQFANMYK
ncbi:unnamed protein product [Vitrella brassicaformis CCMP3155]|uniref:2Fe-2S ferredoxin-type domain-containing protein n=1 Tax=Vitrella brassicaformis (strain CCMP3155) TaxID=1169540 RepID=A0A0G4EFE2_VITBC|nr:unnamed protein product [Vitrella brassicaformis CCMP3155]|mmetsp:Transcript_14858/g.35395  ORF Transcript_14858/g.35395 Transcript_14858/m.35395 type:complete len:169 (-) Transcript_14858:147-653(-)|eukprot:CEL94088.1 unnamed protein product [Vitrella brassicaformis CCMP3155]